MIKVTVWNEFYHEKYEEPVKAVYPDGIHAVLAEFLGKEEDITVRCITQDGEDCGLTEQILDDTDVLIWWAHARHKYVPDEVATMVRDAVFKGMGIIFLHSAHNSKVFKALMGTPCNLGWREDGGEFERVWVVDPGHPITQGIDRYFELPREEVYCEPFGIPEPDKLIFIGAYESGEVIRSGCCYRRGNGRVFYFQPGHEFFPTFYIPVIQTIIKNAVRWAKPVCRIPKVEFPLIAPPVRKV